MITIRRFAVWLWAGRHGAKLTAAALLAAGLLLGSCEPADWGW